ncbi:hypothetical protein [Dethiosulfatarculus sandiegensis]|uniref:FeS-binding protein n=1 Tax=Dethiosulfatarculus sandiegensis TaxID=1429043 RepID=A0A0D2K0J9_9BACT|nr:hypothetical protein [Dethiosulfatarculus sandiegensis]KIX15265.1 FeS-binding protein [Dethiosulfatarculus sandiegensis]
MKAVLKNPGGKALSWAYGLAVFLALFSGFGQMPILKRYYFSDLPLMGWSQDFYILSDLHYLAAVVLLFLLAWRVSLAAKVRATFKWGPKTKFGWFLLLVLTISGACKAIVNTGAYIPPNILVILDFCHLGSAMVFMISGLAALIMGRKAAQPT